MQKQSMKWVLVLALLALPVSALAVEPCPIKAPCATDSCPEVTAPSVPCVQAAPCDPEPCPLGLPVVQAVVGENFAEQHLPFARFRNRSLQSACFYKSILTEADFRGASLVGADLRETSLMGADMRRTILSAARLEGANLRGALIKHATLVGATYDDNTRFPTGFVPEQWGMVRVCH